MWSVLLTFAMTLGSPAGAAAMQDGDPRREALAATILERINEYRQKRGLKPLESHPLLAELARQHSRRMAQDKVRFGHAGFSERADRIAEELRIRRVAENVAMNEGFGHPAIRAVEGWIDSPTHVQHIRGRFDVTGIGIARNDERKYYFTQIFALLRQPR